MMGRLRVVGLCVVALLAFGALSAAAAQAGQVGECLKVAKNAEKKFTGKYTDKNCVVAATPAQEEEGKTNKYEFSPGVKPANGKFTQKSGSVVMESLAGTVLCTASATVGEWTSSTTGKERTTFTGCEFKMEVGSEGCHSAGQPRGTIVTNQLDTRLIDNGEHGAGGGEPAPGEVWDEVVSPSGPTGVQAEYMCAGLVEVQSLGSVAGVFTPASLNVMTKKAEVRFEAGQGEQDQFLEVSIGGGPFEPGGPEVEKLTAPTKLSGKVEIRS